nr:immunoglobulin heavy chain junction region [Macaca mulatta]
CARFQTDYYKYCFDYW